MEFKFTLKDGEFGEQLFITGRDERGLHDALALAMRRREPGAEPPDEVFIGEYAGAKVIRPFLQAAVDFAWQLGISPGDLPDVTFNIDTPMRSERKLIVAASRDVAWRHLEAMEVNQIEWDIRLVGESLAGRQYDRIVVIAPRNLPEGVAMDLWIDALGVLRNRLSEDGKFSVL